MKRFSNFKLGMGIIIKADKDWRGIRRPQAAMHLQLPRFLVDNLAIFPAIFRGPASSEGHLPNCIKYDKDIVQSSLNLSDNEFI